MSRPKGVQQKRDESKYWLPVGISLVNPPEVYNKATKLTFLDPIHGEFISTFSGVQGAKASTHPKAVQLRREATNIIVHSGPNPSNNPKVREKANNTMIVNYGVKNAMESKVFIDKIAATCKEKFGTEHPAELLEFKEKSKKTCLENWGVDNGMKVEEFKDKMKATNLEVWGYENAMFNSEIKEKQALAARKWQEEEGKLNILPNGKNLNQYCLERGIGNTTGANKVFLTYGPEVAQTWIDTYERSEVSSLEIKFNYSA